MFFQKGTKLIKYRGGKGKFYDIILLNWGINNYDVYNRNRLIKIVISTLIYFFV
jgi:hypothetical protein